VAKPAAGQIRLLLLMLLMVVYHGTTSAGQLATVTRQTTEIRRQRRVERWRRLDR